MKNRDNFCVRRNEVKPQAGIFGISALCKAQSTLDNIAIKVV